MKTHPNQLEIDFAVPARDPLTVGDIAKAMCISTAKIYAAIECGQLEAVTLNRDSSVREQYIVPLKNYIAWLNNTYADELHFRFPSADPLSPERIARALSCSHQHVINLIKDEEFPNARNLARPGKKPHYSIPLRDLVAFVNRRRVGGVA